MAVWRVSEPYINIWLRDKPLIYRPSRGLPVEIKLSYKQRDETDNSGPWYTSPGLSWNFNYVSYVYTPAPWNGLAYGADVYFAGGGTAHYTVSLGANYYNNLALTYTWDGTKISQFELHHPDGSTDIYGFRRVDGSGGCNYWFLTKKIDPIGNEIQFSYPGYSSSDMNVKLGQITDVDGKTTSISYVTGTCYIDTITDPFSRTVTFSYTANGSGDKLLTP